MATKKFFTLGGPTESSDADSSPFSQHGFYQNPFPASGVPNDVLFTDHMPRELGRINDWLHQSQRSPYNCKPLAISGSLGVGKTHLLASLERGLQDSDYAVLNKVISAKDLSKLLLSDLLLPEAASEAAARDSGTPAEWILDLFDVAKANDPALVQALSWLPPGSVVAAIFKSVIAEVVHIDVEWVLRYFCRAHVTDSQLNKLGVSGRLRGEGESLQALGELAKLAVHLGIVTGPWFIFLDQLEDLFRPGAVSAGRKVRFLTDLRTLVDIALAGAPISILIAWNTAVDASTEKQLEQEYRALWSRLSNHVNLPMLNTSQLQSFARVYLDRAKLVDPIAGKNPELAEAFCQRLLTQGMNRILAELGKRNWAKSQNLRISLRDALDYWRDAALALVDTPSLTG